MPGAPAEASRPPNSALSGPSATSTSDTSTRTASSRGFPAAAATHQHGDQPCRAPARPVSTAEPARHQEEEDAATTTGRSPVTGALTTARPSPTCDYLHRDADAASFSAITARHSDACVHRRYCHQEAAQDTNSVDANRHACHGHPSCRKEEAHDTQQAVTNTFCRPAC